MPCSPPALTDKSWLRVVGRQGEKRELHGFVFGLQSELRALRDRLLQHPRFGWTALDKAKLKEQHKSDAAAKGLLLPRIVQVLVSAAARRVVVHRIGT
jgi:hypothetical protein